MQIKFAAYVFTNVFPIIKLDRPFFFDNNTFAIHKSFSDYFNTSDNAHWKEWLGTLFWEDITTRNPLICLTWKETTCTALDHENVSLLDKLNKLYHALLLTGPWKNDGRQAHSLTGTGEIIENTIKLNNLSEVGHINLWRHSSYYEVDPIWNWQSQELLNVNSLEKWKTNFSGIEKVISNGSQNLLISLGCMALQSGFHDGLLDFRIPNFVRAIETVVALPIKTGKVEFAKRTKQLLPSKFTYPLGVDLNTIDSILENAYQVRSDCVHGKPFADTLRVTLGTNFSSELPKYELGIEMAARAVLENAITNQTILANSNSRLSLEAAWSKGIIL